MSVVVYEAFVVVLLSNIAVSRQRLVDIHLFGLEIVHATVQSFGFNAVHVLN